MLPTPDDRILPEPSREVFRATVRCQRPGSTVPTKGRGVATSLGIAMGLRCSKVKRPANCREWSEGREEITDSDRSEDDRAQGRAHSDLALFPEPCRSWFLTPLPRAFGCKLRGNRKQAPMSTDYAILDGGQRMN